MTKKEISQLVLASYTKDTLDEVKVKKITEKLLRKDLKTYIRGLKLIENKKKVVVAIPSVSLYNKSKQLFVDIFPGQTISFTEDRLLLLGAKIKADDMVYELSVRGRLEEMIDDLVDSYD